MQKIVLISLLVLMLSGCASLRKASRNNEGVTNRNSVSEAAVIENNLTGKNFFIRKANVQIMSGDLNERFLASVKYVAPDSFNLSIKSWTGLEVARILLTEDTVLVNDRLQRILYYGKPAALARKFGFSFDLLPVLFGDYIKSGSAYEMVCNNGSADVPAVIRGLKIRYFIDCRRLKSSRIVQEGSTGKIVSEIEFDNFRKADDIIYPSLILVRESKSNTTVKIKIDDVERPWEGNVRFVPGNRYELIELR